MRYSPMSQTFLVVKSLSSEELAKDTWENGITQKLVSLLK